MPNTSANQTQQTTKFDRIVTFTAEEWAIAGCANCGALDEGERVWSSRLSINSAQSSAI
jgi:hypothetical protein